ncbi:MAG: transposase [Niveispirillum sp.]|uniref:transposase n=1 Tax=Niveispirillum sp. TaxID=1917217 RepID=UPI004036950C
MLVLQALHGLSLQQTLYLVRDRLSWMRFCGLGPGDGTPDANMLWDFGEALIAARAPDALFTRLAPCDRCGGLPADVGPDRGCHAGAGTAWWVAD